MDKFKIKFDSRKVVAFFFALSILSTLFTTFFSYQLNDALDKNIRFQNHRNESIEIAEDLRHSSDKLTSFARLYAVTEDPFFKQAYQRIIDMRNGTYPLPSEDEEIDWDMAIINRSLPDLHGPKIRIEDKLIQMGMDKTEINLMYESKS